MGNSNSTDNLTTQGNINLEYHNIIFQADPTKLRNFALNYSHKPKDDAKDLWDFPFIYQLIIYSTRFTQDDLMIVCQDFEYLLKSQIHLKLNTQARIQFQPDHLGAPTCAIVKSRRNCKGIMSSLSDIQPLQLLALMKGNVTLFNQGSQKSINHMINIYNHLDIF